MSVVTQEWTIAKWAERGTAEYHPITEPIGGVVIDAYGRREGTIDFESGKQRRYYKADTGDTVTYTMYEDGVSKAVPIVRITQE